MSPAQRAEGERAKSPESKSKWRRWRRRVWRPGVSAAVGRGLRQGPVQDETQPQALQQPGHGLKQRATNHKAQLLGRAEVTTLIPSAHHESPPLWVRLTCTFLCTSLHSHPAQLQGCSATHSATCSDSSSSKIFDVYPSRSQKLSSTKQEDWLGQMKCISSRMMFSQSEKFSYVCTRCLIGTILCCFFVRQNLCTKWNVQLVDSSRAWSKQEDDSTKRNTRGHFVRTDSLDRDRLLNCLRDLFWRNTESELPDDAAALSQSGPSQDWNPTLLDRKWFHLQETAKDQFSFLYFIIEVQLLYIWSLFVSFEFVFPWRAGLNSVGFNCWVGTLKGLGLTCNFSTSVDTRVIDDKYLYIRMRACFTCT